MTVLVSIVGLALLVLIHEAGHFFTALAVGIRPRSFYIGFPFPPLVKKVRNGIEYGIGAIPLGGLVRIPGMHRPAPGDVDAHFGFALREAPELTAPVRALERELEADDHSGARDALDRVRAALADAELSGLSRRAAERGVRDLSEALGADAYWRQPTWKRVAVVFAGPGINIVFAVGLLALVYVLGVPVANTRDVAKVTSASPAAAAGLRAGDTVVRVAGKPTPTFEAVRRQIQSTKGRPFTVVVLRDGRRVTLGPVRAEYDAAAKRWLFGFEPGFRMQSYGPATALKFAGQDTWAATKGMGVAIANVFRGSDRKELTSAVGIVRISSNALQLSVRLYLQILALVSLSLALLNLLPLLPLDGGHILFSLIEGVRRRAVAREVYERASMIGLALILVVAFIAFSNDLSGTRPG